MVIYHDYKLPQMVNESSSSVTPLFSSSSLTNSFSLLKKYNDEKICKEIISDLVERVEETNGICGSILDDIVSDIFVNEECCAILVSDIVTQVVDDVESYKEILEKHRIETEEDEFLKNLSEEQKTNANLNENEEVTLSESNEIPGNIAKGESDASSIELSDEEFDIEGKRDTDKPKTKASVEEKHSIVPNVVIKKSLFKTKLKIEKLKLKRNTLNRKEKRKNLKVKKVPKLVIKPLLKNNPLPDTDEEKEKTKDLNEVMPPIIVKIPKASLSPNKSNISTTSKSPRKGDKEITQQTVPKLNIKLPKPPAVKNLKILPLSPPEKKSTSSNENDTKKSLRDERKVPKDVDKPDATIKEPVANKSPLKITIKTPPPLSVIRNKIVKPIDDAEKVKENLSEASPAKMAVKSNSEKPRRQVSSKKSTKSDHKLDFMKLLEDESKKRQQEIKKLKLDHDKQASSVETKKSQENKQKILAPIKCVESSPSKKSTLRFAARSFPCFFIFFVKNINQYLGRFVA